MSTVYLIHLDERIGDPTNPRAQAQHYIGYTPRDPALRLRDHRAGRGSAMLAWAAEHGIGFDIVRTWDGGPELERTLKNRKYAPRICPVCAGTRSHTVRVKEEVA